ncbi:MAG: nitrogenase molybdenum-iron protein [Chlorobiaceae bacterium]|nr:nitrogenase molybdenum-iron protein [Chlorobiaceae bacterium]
MSLLKAKASRTREKQLDTLNAWQGTLFSALTEFSLGEPVKRIRTFSQSSEDDLLYALRLLAGIRDSVVVIHAPRGCAAAALFHHVERGKGRWIVTNLDDRDTIMGADGKLRKAVKDVNQRYNPELLFIVSSPVVAINNDDIQSVVEELHEELELDIVPIYVTGFASHHAVTGYDTTLHSLLKYLGGKKGKHPHDDRVNLLSIAEHPHDRNEAQRLLLALGLELNTLPDGASKGSFHQAATARLSLSLDQDSANYLGVSLRDEYDVPYSALPRPVGLGATGRWLAGVGKALGLDESAQKLHEQESEKVRHSIGDFTLKGLQVYLSLAPSTAFGVLELVEELGGEVVGITVSRLDQLHKGAIEELSARHPALLIHVADGQPFEEVNIIKRLSPDLYLGDSLHLAQVGRLGIPVVSLRDVPVLGYRGVTALARRISTALLNRSFGEALSRSSLPYKDGWLRRSPNWHIKKEVK